MRFGDGLSIHERAPTALRAIHGPNEVITVRSKHQVATGRAATKAQSFVIEA
jgi:hypothetical protein